MGWWHGQDGGRVGDEPLDTLGEALREVRQDYVDQFGEEPSLADLSALLSTSLGGLLDAAIHVSLSMGGGARPNGGAQPGGVDRPLRSGDVIALPLADGRFGTARVLDVRRGKCVVQALQGIYERPPRLEHVGELRPLLQHIFKHSGDPLVLRIVDKVPTDATLLGRASVSPAERRAESRARGGWRNISEAILDEWRWEHDREAFIREVREQEREAMEKYKRGG